MTDIIERLRHPQGVWPDLLADMREAADEIERLEDMQANLHGHVKRLEDVLNTVGLILAVVFAATLFGIFVAVFRAIGF